VFGLAANGLPLHAAIEGFVETFDGAGDYASVDGVYHGFDNPAWHVEGDGDIVDGGYLFRNRSEPGTIESDGVGRIVTGRGSFVNRVEIKSPDLGDLTIDHSVDSSGSIYLASNLNPDSRGRSTMSVGIVEQIELGNHSDEWRLLYFVDNEYDGIWVPRGPHVILEIRYDDLTSTLFYSYDNDLGDDVPATEIGPFHLSGSVNEQHVTELRIRAAGNARADGLLDYWSLLSVSDVPGDFNGNGILDAADIDQLNEEVRSNTNDSFYDLNADVLVNDLDRQIWVHDLKQTYFGDADLDGTFDSADLVQVLASGEYEDGVELNSTWLTGDSDGDSEFTSGDLVVALADGGYEAGAAAVPEPAGGMLVIVAAALAATTQRSKTRRA
jgi:hypothetical protein